MNDRGDATGRRDGQYRRPDALRLLRRRPGCVRAAAGRHAVPGSVACRQQEPGAVRIQLRRRRRSAVVRTAPGAEKGAGALRRARAQAAARARARVLPAGCAPRRRRQSAYRAPRGGAEANPCPVVAAVLAGLHYGIAAKLDVGGKHGGNAGATVDSTLPLKVWEALERIRAAKILPQYLGADYLWIYADVKRAESSAFSGEIFPREHDWDL